MVRLTLERGTDLEAQDVFGSMALHVAAMHSDAKMVKLLLDCGARVDCPRRDRATALMIAAGRPEKDIVELLAEPGADLYAKDSHGWMPLQYAARNNNVQVVELLLDKGVGVDCRADSSDDGCKGWTQRDSGAACKVRCRSGSPRCTWIDGTSFGCDLQRHEDGETAA